MTIDNLFDVDCDNVHMVKVDSFEAAMPSQPSEPMATAAQLDFLKSLFNQRTNNEEAMILRTHLLGEYKAGRLTKKMASEAITDVKAMERNRPDYSSLSTLPTTPLEHGQVWVTKTGYFVKVCLNQSGTGFYGKLWSSTHLVWNYTAGILNKLDHIITAEEAKEFSLQWEAENRYCIFCMRHLSDERSEFAGYGEKCASNHGLPWGSV